MSVSVAGFKVDMSLYWESHRSREIPMRMKIAS